MELSILTILGMGLVIGLRHSLDADHVVAVSTIATRTNNILKAGMAGVYWGIGHTFTILLIGIIVLLAKISIPEAAELWFEGFVALVLIYLGVKTVLDARSNLFVKQRNHESIKKFHIRSLLVGMVHGLAGSAALLLLVVSQITNVSEGILFLLLFGIGSIVGMFVIAMLLSLPIRAVKAEHLQKKILYTVGSLSIAFGLSIFVFM